MSKNPNNRIQAIKNAVIKNFDNKFVLKERLKLVLIIFAFYLVLNLFNAGCPIKYVTGLSCPSCGMTRATLAVLRLDFASAFYYHPLFFLAPIMVFLFLFEDRFQKKHIKLAWIVIISLLIIVYFLRFFFFKSDIVSFDFPSRFMLKFKL